MEKVFSYFYKNEIVKRSQKKSAILFEDINVKIGTFTNYASIQHELVEVGGSLWGVGFVDNLLLLPLIGDWTENKKLNYDILKLLVLKSIAIKANKINFSFDDRSKSQPRWQMLKNLYIINNWLDLNFEGYQDLETQVNQELTEKLKFDHELIQQISSRKILSDSQIYKIDQCIRQSKRNDRPPVLLHALIPLPMRSNSNLSETLLDQLKNSNISQSKKRNRSEYSKQNKEEDKNANPVTHSFEKSETLDDYDGGKRIKSGDDELNEHENALDEVELNNSTSEGNASSIYNQNFVSSQDINQTGSTINNQSIQQLTYPEWNYRNQVYIKNFCTLFEQVLPRGSEYLIKEMIQTKYKVEILIWKKKFLQLLNEPIWKKKLTSGSEIDIDQVVRIFPVLKSYSGYPPIYQTKKVQEHLIDLSILVDISYSTETWLNGVKVLDIIRDSIVLFAFIAEEIGLNVSAALTYSSSRKNITYLELKSIETDWNDFYSNLHEFHSRQYTRLGPAIRHCLKKTRHRNSECKKPMILVFTDGKPTDLDPYEGVYGQEDLRKTIVEAKNQGTDLHFFTVSDLNDQFLSTYLFDHKVIAQPEDFCKKLYDLLRLKKH